MHKSVLNEQIYVHFVNSNAGGSIEVDSVGAGGWVGSIS